MTKRNLPIFEVEYDENSVFNCVSVVDEPAVGQYFITLSKQTEIKMAIDEEKREVLGVALIPEQLIYRRNDDGKEFYLKFSADTIKKFALNFFETHKNTNGDVQHQFSVNGLVFYQSFLIDRKMGINPEPFKTLPDGTWLLGAHIYNDNVWEMIKSGELKGFSVDLSSKIVKAKMREIDTIEELEEYLNNYK